MGLFDQLPYTNFHELNLTEMIKRIEELSREMREFKVVNKISYGGDWDITKQYPAWTVVCVNGTEGYISIKPVPLGVNYTNTDYWRLVADFTVQLADLGNRVSTLEGQMLTANNNISNLQTVTNWLRGLLNNSTRKVICISDSYGLTPDTNSSWIPKVKNCLGISNANFYRSQANGAGFIGVYPSVTFINQLSTLASGMTSDEKNAINDVIIAGGFNDAGRLNIDFTEAQLRTAIESCIAYINTTFPNAKTYLCFLGWSITDYAIHSTIRRVQNIYEQTGINVGERVCVIEGVNWLHRIALVDGTGYHPNASCGTAFGLSIASVLNGGSVCCDLAPTTTGYIPITLDAITANVSSLTTEDLRQTYRNGTVFTSWKTIQFNNLNALGGTGEIAIATITDGCTVGGNGFSDAIIMPCNFVVGSTVYDGNILIHEGKLHLGNKSGVVINANSTIRIIYGAGCGDVMI